MRNVGVGTFPIANELLYGDAARLRKFDGIAQKVEQNLAQPGRVSAIDAARLRLDEDAEIEVLFACLARHQGDSAFDRVQQVEIDLFKLELARLELRDIENVVHDAKKRL